MKKLALTLAVAVTVATGAVAAQDQRPSTILQKILVKVNGEILTQTELEQRQIEIVRARPDAAQLTNETLQDVVNEVTPGILVKAIDDLLLIQRAKELGYGLSNERFEAAIETIKTDNNLTDEDLQRELDLEGLTLADYRNLMERDLLMRAITTQEILAGQNLTQAELRQYYQSHPDEFLTPATVTLREVFLPVATEGTGAGATVNVGQDEAARTRLVAARERIVGGEDMLAVVTEVSEGGSKANGGLIGPIRLGDVNPNLRAAVESLAEGEITEPIRMTNGYHLFRMESRTSPEPQAFEQVREQIYQNILMSRAEVETEKYLQGLRAQAVIEWEDAESRALYERGMQARAGDSGESGGAPRR